MRAKTSETKKKAKKKNIKKYMYINKSLYVCGCGVVGGYFARTL